MQGDREPIRRHTRPVQKPNISQNGFVVPAVARLNLLNRGTPARPGVREPLIVCYEAVMRRGVDPDDA